MTKDEALKMAIEEIEGWFEDRYVTTYMDRCKENPAWLACKEALEQQEVGDAEIKQMLDDIEYYKDRLAKYEDVL